MSGVPWSDALDAWRAHRPAAPVSSPLARDELLRLFHPDHRPGAMTPLRVGASAGTPCVSELASLLHADSPVRDVDIAGSPHQDTDVLVIGGGGAGCVAALCAARSGARVMIASKLRVGDGNTVMAEGGIQAAVGEEDSLQRHFEDTVRAGRFAGDRELAAALVTGGPAAIRWLIGEGMSFDLEPGSERIGGRLRRARVGGASAARLLSYRDQTGLEMMRVLREAVRLQHGITTLDGHPALELLTDARGGCAGAVLFEHARGRLSLVHAGATILATGGAGRLHLGGFPTSNHYGATADGLVLAYRAGAALRELDSFQYHPSGLAAPTRLAGLLVSEAARTAGARLVNGHGERFVDELAARDVVAAAILRELEEGRGVAHEDALGVWLDTPSLEAEQPGILRERLVTLCHLAERAGIDPSHEPLLVRPTLHYQNGGVAIDPDGQTTLAGLFACGEVAGGIHGRNRLMGNALLELVAFGRRAGVAAARRAETPPRGPIGVTHLADWQRALIAAELPLDARAPTLFPSYGNFDLDAALDAGGAHP